METEIKPWYNWKNMPVGHEQAVVALRALQDHTHAFMDELKTARQNLADTKSASQTTYDTIVSSAKNKCDTTVSSIQNQYKTTKQQQVEKCDSDIKKNEYRANKVTNITSACNNFINAIPSGDSGMVDIANGYIKKIKDSKEKVIDAIKAKSQAYRKLRDKNIEEAEHIRDADIAEAERIRNESLKQAKKELVERDESAQRRFTQNYETICEKRRQDISQGFNKKTIQEYRQEIQSSRFNAANYECPSEVPDYIMLGEIGIAFKSDSQDENAVVQSVDLQTSEFAEKLPGEYVVKIPYAQRLSDGISLLIRYSLTERVFAQDMMQPLLMKLFMSFPAGKLEVTMIDPLEMGASFPDIPKFAEGPNSSRVIDTKIWSQEKDIDNAIATLRQRLENMTQNYGQDQKSRLKKEVIRALAITDFPVGFNDTALKNLHAIVRNSAALGVCVLICANDVELEKLKERNGQLVDEISQSLVKTRTSDRRLFFDDSVNSQLFLQLDDMHDAFEHKDVIIPVIANNIEHMPTKIERFDSMYKDDIYDSNNWFTGVYDEVAIPIGIKGANTVINMVLGRAGGPEQHVLISGQTGTGKSKFFHTLIMSTLISYSPDEVQMYLLDFKEGVEFNAYARHRLPSLRVVAINSEREFGLIILKELCNELESRAKYFRDYNVTEINDYVQLPGVPKMPQLLLIFDEVQELFRSKGDGDTISSECLSCINKLIMQGRAMGIHVILACQDFRNCPGLEQFFSQMAVRIALKGSEEGASSILSSDNDGIQALQNESVGAAIYNTGWGNKNANIFFQISYISEEERLELLARLDEYFTDPNVAALYKDLQTRILLTNAEDNIYNCFNKLILEGVDSLEHLGESEDGYGLILGQSFEKIFIPEIRLGRRDNLMIVTKDEKMALSLFEYAAMSVLYEELNTKADKSNALVYIADMFDAKLSGSECDFDHMESCFSKQVRIAKESDIEDMITSLYEIVIGRSEGTMSDTERLFFMFFGINRARFLLPENIYEDNPGDELSPIEKLKIIISKGPKYGVNCIMWEESIKGIEYILGEGFKSMFGKCIAYGLDEDSMNHLVAESDVKNIRGKTAVYYDNDKGGKNIQFRPYEIPAKSWVERYAKKYEEIIRQGG